MHAAAALCPTYSNAGQRAIFRIQSLMFAKSRSRATVYCWSVPLLPSVHCNSQYCGILCCAIMWLSPSPVYFLSGYFIYGMQHVYCQLCCQLCILRMLCTLMKDYLEHNIGDEVNYSTQWRRTSSVEQSPSPSLCIWNDWTPRMISPDGKKVAVLLTVIGRTTFALPRRTKGQVPRRLDKGPQVALQAEISRNSGAI